MLDMNKSTTLARTTKLSKALNSSEKNDLNPNPVNFIASSATKITVNAVFILSNISYYSSSIGYLSIERITVLPMMQQLMKKVKKLLF